MSHGILVPPEMRVRRKNAPHHGLSHAIPPLGCSHSQWLVLHGQDKFSRSSRTYLILYQRRREVLAGAPSRRAQRHHICLG